MSHTIHRLGVEQNRKQEFGSFQELLDLVPATFSPSRSAGSLFVLTSCFKCNVTLSGRTSFISGYLVLTRIIIKYLEIEFGKVTPANKKVELRNKFLKSVLAS